MSARKTDHGPTDLIVDGNEYAELRDALEASRAECARLRVALEASRLSHDYVDEDVWYSCPKWPGFNGTCPRCANAGKPCECECYCGADSHNARIAAALNGATDATVGEP